MANTRVPRKESSQQEKTAKVALPFYWIYEKVHAWGRT